MRAHVCIQINMAAKSRPFEIVHNKKGKAKVWKHFRFLKDGNDVDNTRVACRLCFVILKYSGNTTDLIDHMRRKHPANLKQMEPWSSRL